MKFKFLAVFLVIVLFSFAVSAQERNFELEVLLDETNITRTAEDIPATVIITNKSEQILYTDGLGSVEFKFSKCLTENGCGLIKNDFIAQARIPRKKLSKNESFKFQTNLAEQIWFKSNSDDSNLRTDFKEISSENIFFTANIKMLLGYRNAANPKFTEKDKKIIVVEKTRKKPQYEKFTSNSVTVTLN